MYVYIYIYIRVIVHGMLLTWTSRSNRSSFFLSLSLSLSPSVSLSLVRFLFLFAIWKLGYVAALVILSSLLFSFFFRQYCCFCRWRLVTSSSAMDRISPFITALSSIWQLSIFFAWLTNLPNWWCSSLLRCVCVCVFVLVAFRLSASLSPSHLHLENV